MGDGINDASALHAADVGISVDSAVDVAKDAADIVLLEKNLPFLCRAFGKEERLLQILSSMYLWRQALISAICSVWRERLFFSPFSPLPKQILLTNLLTDFPEMTIATDNVDKELVEKPRRWNISFIP